MNPAVRVPSSELADAPTIVIAGASGFIGRALIPCLLERFPQAKILALSRIQQHSSDPRVEWKSCDLFSLEQLERVLPPKADLAFYLVHSMGPTAHLDQGSFADYDLILANNFSRAVAGLELKQLVYLGGIIPDSPKLSLHLRSRLEIEENFKDFELPITVFRAGLILGEDGSSFQILLKLVKHLPLMICPLWTQTLTTPVDLTTVLQSLVAASLDEKHIGKTYDLAGCQPLTYFEMIQETARKMKLKRYAFRVPFFSPRLSRLWVRLVTNTPKNLVYPLIESLEHPMTARQEFLFNPESTQRTYAQLLDSASLKTRRGKSMFRFTVRRKTVRSVQRLTLRRSSDAQWTKTEYFAWLPKFLWPLIQVHERGTILSFRVLGLRKDLLKLKHNEERSAPDRQMLDIVGGILAAGENRGRLEFRVALSRRIVLAAIHDFRPALPWFIYIYTQAKLHLWIMNAFERHLNRGR